MVNFSHFSYITFGVIIEMVIEMTIQWNLHRAFGKIASFRFQISNIFKLFYFGGIDTLSPLKEECISTVLKSKSISLHLNRLKSSYTILLWQSTTVLCSSIHSSNTHTHYIVPNYAYEKHLQNSIMQVQNEIAGRISMSKNKKMCRFSVVVTVWCWCVCVCSFTHSKWLWLYKHSSRIIDIISFKLLISFY